MGNHPEINKAHVILAIHTTDTSWQDNFSWWQFQQCHSNWVSQPRYRLKPFGGLSWGGRYEGVPPVNNQASSILLLFHKTQTLLCYCWYILTKWNVRKSGLKDSLSLFTPLWFIPISESYRGKDQLQKLRAWIHARTGCDSTPWRGILLGCFSAVLWSAEINEKMWSSWDAEL